MQTLWVHTNTDCLDTCLPPLVQPLSSPFVAALGNICSTDDDKTLLLYSWNLSPCSLYRQVPRLFWTLHFELSTSGEAYSKLGGGFTYLVCAAHIGQRETSWKRCCCSFRDLISVYKKRRKIPKLWLLWTQDCFCFLLPVTYCFETRITAVHFCSRSGWQRLSRRRWSQSSSQTNPHLRRCLMTSAWTNTQPTSCWRERARWVWADWRPTPLKIDLKNTSSL